MANTHVVDDGSSACAPGEPASAGNWRCGHDTADHGEQHCRRDQPSREAVKSRGTPAGADAHFVDPWRGC